MGDVPNGGRETNPSAPERTFGSVIGRARSEQEAMRAAAESPVSIGSNPTDERQVGTTNSPRAAVGGASTLAPAAPENEPYLFDKLLIEPWPSYQVAFAAQVPPNVLSQLDEALSGGRSGEGGRGGGFNNGGGHGNSRYGGNNTRDGSYGGRPGWSGNNPVLLDLSGNGLAVDGLGTSSQFLDMEGNGHGRRTAWAGQGTGVLVIDADGDGEISRSSEFVFTQWDSSAKSDLAAIKSVFDTNRNGRLDAGDARWGEFRVSVDGQLRTLAELGIQSIDLTPSGSGQVFEDGSAITGRTTFTRTDGSTGQVGDAVLGADGRSYRVEKTTSGQTTTIKGFNKDGSLAFTETVTRSADGSFETTQFDDNGDGVVDRSQTEQRITHASGEIERVVKNFRADGSLANSTTTFTSADRRTVSTSLDQNGDGIVDQVQVFHRNQQGATETVVTERSANGAVLSEVKTMASADGLGKTVLADTDGNQAYDRKQTEATVVSSTGRTKTIETRVAASVALVVGTLVGKEEAWTSTDGKSQTIKSDRDGDGVFEERVTAKTQVGADGHVFTTTRTFDAAGRLLASEVTSVSGSGLVKSRTIDVDGDGDTDLVTAETTQIDANGTIVQTVDQKSRDGHLLGVETTSTSADGKLIVMSVDANGDGATDFVKHTSTDAQGVTTVVLTELNPDGSLKSRTTETTLAGGLSKTTQIDADGDDAPDRTITDVTTRDGGNNAVQTVTTTARDGTVMGKSILSSAPNGLSSVLSVDLTGDGVIDRTTSTATVLNADSSRTTTTTLASAGGVTLSKSVEVTSANRRVVTTNVDGNGDGRTDQITTDLLNDDGSRKLTAVDHNPNGSVRGRTETEVSASGLRTTARVDLNGDGVFERTTIADTVINPDLMGSDANKKDGSRTQTVTTWSSNGTLLSSVETTLAPNGLSSFIRYDVDGDGLVERRASDVTTLGHDGTTTRTVSQLGGTGALLGSVSTTTDVSGQKVTVKEDFDGNGVADRTTTSASEIDAEGTRTETIRIADRSGDAATELISEATMVISADKRSVSRSRDLDGDGIVDERHTTSVTANGSVTDTFSTYGMNELVSSQHSVTASANGLTVWTATDVNGDGVNERTSTAVKVLNANGSTTESLSVFRADGSLKEKTVVDTSASGLRTVTQWAPSGSAVTRTRTEEVVLNADGSTVETTSYTKSGGALESRAVTTTSADKRTVVNTFDFNGNGTVDRTVTSTLADDGRLTVIQRGLIPDGYDETDPGEISTVTTSDGLSKVVEYRAHDNDYASGYRVIGRDATTVALNADGGTTATTELYALVRSGFSQVFARTGLAEVTTSGNGFDVTARWDVDGNGTFDRTQTSQIDLLASGGKRTTLDTWEGSSLARRFITETSGNGLLSTTSWQIDPADPLNDGSLAQNASDVTVINADGSSTRTVTSKSGSTVLSTSVTKTSANGLLVTTEENLDGLGGVDRVRTSVSKTLADGTTVQSLTSVDAAGKRIEAATVTVNAADRTTTTERDADGDGSIDQREVTTTLLDGSVRTAITNMDVAGIARSIATITTSADGLSTNWAWDFNGDGITDQSRVTILFNLLANGEYQSRTTDYTGPNYTVIRRVEATKSLDGRVLEMNTVYDTSRESDRREQYTTNIDGSETVYTANDGEVGKTWLLHRGGIYWRQDVADNVVSKTSADGLTTVTFADYDDSANTSVYSDDLAAFGYEHKEVAQTRVDGSVITSITDVNSAGAVVARGVMMVSSDGRTTNLKKDANNDGFFEHLETAVNRIDGSIAKVVEDYNADGSLRQKVTTEVSADGRNTFVVTAVGSTGTGVATGAYVDFSIGAETNDTLRGTASNDDLDGGAGSDKLFGEAGNDTLDGGAGDDSIDGGAGRDRLLGGDGNDYLTVGAGDFADGGTGHDTMALADQLANIKALRVNGSLFVASSTTSSVIQVQDVEQVFATSDQLYATLASIIQGEARFDAQAYLSNYSDLRQAFGNDADKALLHFVRNGFAERRLGTDALEYVAANADLMAAYRDLDEAAIRTAGANHFRNTGSAQGRATDFNAEQYFANYGDVRATFGSPEAAVLHFIKWGSLEGRTSGSLTSSTYANDIVGGSGADILRANSGNDRLSGGAGSDILEGYRGADQLDGGTGNDTASYENAGAPVGVHLGASRGFLAQARGDTFISIENVQGSAYGDWIIGDKSANQLWGGAGNDRLNGAAGADRLYGGAGNDILQGGLGADYLAGEDGDDVLWGVTSEDQFFGGAGVDTAVVEDVASAYAMGRLVKVDGQAYFGHPMSGLLRLGGDIEQLAFEDGAVFDLRRVRDTDWLEYIASHGDLIQAFGDHGALPTMAQLRTTGQNHYFNAGWAEGRTVSFNGLEYNASYADLMNGYGTNGDAGTYHYIGWGYYEGRQIGFDSVAYLASYGDLATAYGTNLEAVTIHYITNGYQEGRTVKAFSALTYIASYGDVVEMIEAAGSITVEEMEAIAANHFGAHGKAEGRTDKLFNPTNYLAANSDLVSIYGDNLQAATLHYIQHGYYEGRPSGSSTTTGSDYGSGSNGGPGLPWDEPFDPLLYVATHTDLMSNLNARGITDAVSIRAEGMQHYLNAGMAEGRNASFDPLEYVLTSGDLWNAFSNDLEAATLHYINAGHVEGRPQSHFDPLLYVAGYDDLVRSFSGLGSTEAIREAGARHWADRWWIEGRAADAFNAVQYLKNYADLGKAFGSDTDAAAMHFILAGYHEGRTDDVLMA
ncbi:MAG TPA: calcium-binding protein [Mesorhizobium sp.]|nr:calcium-binding protein [Mesorhizobium sp.]